MRLRWLAGAVCLVVALGCACGSDDPCPEGQRPSYGSCLPDDCGDYPFGAYAGGDYIFVEGRDEGAMEPDGTETAPFRTLTEAIAAATARRNPPPIVVASGTYGERFLLGDAHDGLHIEGVCRENIVVASPDDLPAVDVEAGADTEITLHGLTFRNGGGPAVVVGGGQLVLDHVTVDDAVAAGVAAYGAGASLLLTDALVAGVRRHADTGAGYGLAVGSGAHAAASGISFGPTGTAAVLADGFGSDLVLAYSAVDGRLGVAQTALQGAGVLVVNGATAQVSDVVLTSPFDLGLAVAGPSAATLTRVSVLAVLPAADGGLGGGGTGVSVSGGATLDAADLSVHGASRYGVSAWDPDTTVDVRLLRIVDAVPAGHPSAGAGLVVGNGAAVTASDVLVQGARVYAAIASGTGAQLTLTDAELLDPFPGDALGIGGGLLAQGGAALDAERVTVRGATGVGVLVDDATATLTDVDVRGTLRALDQTAAAGAAVQAGGALDAELLVVSESEGPGLLVSGGSAGCTGCDLLGNTFAGLVVTSGGDATLSDAQLADTVVDASLAGGLGAVVDGRQSALDLQGSTVTGNALGGVSVTGDAAVTLVGNVLDGGPVDRAVWPTGTAVFASGSSAARLWLADNDLQHSEGGALFLDDGTAALGGNRWLDNAVDVVQQLCGDHPPPDGLQAEPTASTRLCPAYDQPVELLSFATTYQPLVLAE
ncbi:MAG: DUF1565 domain-containing protein [Myxococcota bacterium]